MEQVRENINVAVIVHGGAYAIPDAIKEKSVDGCKLAAKKGFEILLQNGTALDAVEKAIRSLENNPVFDAGTGSVLTLAEEVEMDAIIMDGKNLNFGAVACVKTVKNPISLARAVMEKTDHCLIVGGGADSFARALGIKETSVEELTTQEAIDELKKFKKYDNTVGSLFNINERDGSTNLGHDTVGCVAIDFQGNIAAGTSTGGITAKMSGRVGDSPIIGSGCYANKYAGASSTGHGESIMKVCLTKGCTDGITDLLKKQNNNNNNNNNNGNDQNNNNESQLILKSKLDDMKDLVDGCGGLISINKNGEIANAFTTPRMCYAQLSSFGNDGKEYNGVCGVEINEKRNFTL